MTYKARSSLIIAIIKGKLSKQILLNIHMRSLSSLCLKWPIWKKKSEKRKVGKKES
jgi:hypothetical protein